MYTILISAHKSDIDGKGVFAAQDIKKGSIVWKYDSTHDCAISQAEFETKDDAEKEHLHRVAYLSPWTSLWVYPPAGDLAEYTNHSNDNNLSVKFDPKISPEPYFIANRNIVAGEEITNNYYEFDAITQTTQPDWTK